MGCPRSSTLTIKENGDKPERIGKAKTENEKAPDAGSTTIEVKKDVSDTFDRGLQVGNHVGFLTVNDADDDATDPSLSLKNRYVFP